MSVISIEPSVLTLRECRQLCRESSACSHVTHFGPGEFELVNTCVLFSSCDSTLPCIDCISEDTTRPCTLCSSRVVEANIGANDMLDFLRRRGASTTPTTAPPTPPCPPTVSSSPTWRARLGSVSQWSLGMRSTEHLQTSQRHSLCRRQHHRNFQHSY